MPYTGRQLFSSIAARTLICLCAAVLVAGPVWADDDDDDGGSTAVYVPGQVVVKLKLAADLPAVASAYRLDPAPLDRFGSRPIYRLRILDGTSPPSRATQLANDRRVAYAEPNYLGQTPEGTQDSSWAGGGDAGGYSTQWAGPAVRLQQAHQVTRGAGVTVAVLDTGVDVAHPALAGKLAPGYDFVDMDGDPREEGTHTQDRSFGHGTHVAGLVALAAPEAKIMPLRVLDRTGKGDVWVMAEALRFALDPDGNPATDDGAKVINLSFATLRTTNLLRDIVGASACSGDDDGDDDGNASCAATSLRGAVVVTAAGNRGGSTREYPAAEDVRGSLAVGATTATGGLAAFSTRGTWVKMGAPGERVLSAVPGGGYGSWSGTSMAAPLVAGEAALVRAAAPLLDPAAVAQRIVATAKPISGTSVRRADIGAALGR